MGVYIANMEKPKSCNECRYKMWTMNETFCNLLDKMLGDEDIRPDCPLIEIDDTVWENEKHKLIRMTNEARINKEMAERRADEGINE